MCPRTAGKRAFKRRPALAVQKDEGKNVIIDFFTVQFVVHLMAAGRIELQNRLVSGLLKPFRKDLRAPPELANGNLHTRKKKNRYVLRNNRRPVLTPALFRVGRKIGHAGRLEVKRASGIQHVRIHDFVVAAEPVIDRSLGLDPIVIARESHVLQEFPS